MGETEPRPLRLLIAEDSEDDALLLVRELQRGGYQPDMLQVDSAEDMQAALEARSWDLIITDHNMPGFDSHEALALARAHDPNIPFILVSGSIGEEIAVDAMKSGVHDYIMKGNLSRLLPAIERELREAENRRAHAEAEATIRHMAFHDSLTGLVNRNEFEHRLAEAVRDAREDDQLHALLYLDLDQFKLVNDSCGHIAGDELLRRLALRLKSRIRDSDTLARLGGDEFGVLLRNCPPDRAEHIARSLLDSLREYRFLWEDRSFQVGASIGLVNVSGEQNAHDLLSVADMACYAAKDYGRNRVHVYSASDEELTRRRGELHWIQRLQAALAADELLLYQQPIRALNNGPAHCELLLRLPDEHGELVGPDTFIPAAERYNLMPEIDRWVIHHACRTLQAIQQLPAGDTTPGTLFINLSAITLSDDELFDYIRNQLQQHAIAPPGVGFEITETAAIADFDRALNLIRQLRSHGCKVALDDFGTGMSSFSYLKALTVDYVKIDGGFVRHMLDDPIDSAIVESVNNIARLAGMQTIAEYVENDGILQRCRELGIDYAQGYAVQRPIPFPAPHCDAPG